MYFNLSLACVLFSASLLAQSSTGTATMIGAVTDSTGSVVPGAKVTVTNKDAGFVFNSVSTAEGTWYIPNLNPGNYQLKIEAAGFKLVAEADFLRHPEDPRDAAVFRPQVPVDEFVLKYQKPL